MNTTQLETFLKITETQNFTAAANLLGYAQSTVTMQIKQLYQRIGKLGFFDRAIVLLWLESLSYEEIAAITGISVKAVSMRLLRIKRQLKDMND